MKVRLFSLVFLSLLSLFLKESAAYDSVYEKLFGSYIEISSGTQVKRIGETPGGMGGHVVVYVKGLCKDYSVNYPKVKVCDPKEKQLYPHDGVGITVDSQFKNVNWVAVPGYDFFMNGELSRGAELNENEMQRTYAEAFKLRIFENVKLKDTTLSPSLPEEEYTRTLISQSISTDFALTYGRDMTSHRVPISPQYLKKISDYLNEINEPYIRGSKIYKWSMFTNNCAHLSAKIFSLANIRDAIPQDLSFSNQLLHLAIPANVTITAQNKTNFRKIDAASIWENDPQLRETIIQDGLLPVGAGSLTRFLEVVQNNKMYAKNLKRFILPPKPLCHSVEFIRNTYLSVEKAQYLELKDNFEMWLGKYKNALASTKQYPCREKSCAEFMKKYEGILRSEITKTNELLAKIKRVL